MESRVANRKSSKKEKTKVKKEAKEPPATATTSTIEAPAGPSTSTSLCAAPAPSTSGGPSTSKAPTDKTLKRSKLDKLGDPQFKKAKEDYSVAEDPKASDVYKSLFTTHETEKTQGRAHWVTYNPYY